MFAFSFFGDLAFKHYFKEKQETSQPTQYQKYSEDPLAEVDPALLTVDGQTANVGDFARDASAVAGSPTVNVLFCSG